MPKIPLRLQTVPLFLASVTLSFLGIAALAAPREPRPPSQPRPAPPASQADALAAWSRIATVLQSPRCLNCHQAESPLQGDSRRPHIPHVVRGSDGHGVGAMRCGNCHNETGNNLTSRTPGAPHWSLAPISMLWQGLSVGELCRSVRDPQHNGKRSAEALIEHMGSDPLVGWGWNPGPGLKPVPIPRLEVVSLMKTWTSGGMPCPQ
ncbi:MAG TPA: hypothetical protein VMH00_16495 [Candidatus Limnocylindrales bacterium]|nr:hypothetical protein [Candidatus Limnocylindrales bacterium]